MKKKIFGVCTICGRNIYENEKHRCKFELVKDNLIHYMKMNEQYFHTIWEAQNFIRDNTWNIEDKEKIKQLLLIIWDSLSNQEFEIKTNIKGSDSNE